MTKKTRILSKNWYSIPDATVALGISQQLLYYYIAKPRFKPEDIKKEDGKVYAKVYISGKGLIELKNFLSFKAR